MMHLGDDFSQTSSMDEVLGDCGPASSDIREMNAQVASESGMVLSSSNQETFPF